MIDLLIKVLNKIQKVAAKQRLEKTYRGYLAMMGQDHSFSAYPRQNIGDCSGDPREMFSHYDAYSFWLAEKLHELGNGKKIIDLGNRKVTNAMLSVTNDVTAVVLEHCDDKISKVRYVKHDIALPLPFGADEFDVFTSLGTIQLVGLGRYGDMLSPDALPNLIAELDRVLKPASHLIFSTSLGPNHLYFNNGWGLEHETILQLFGAWKLVDYLIDNASVECPPPYEERYTKAINYEGYDPYRVAFYHFAR